MPESWPNDAAAAAALLALVVRDVDRRGESEADALLAELLSTAWPTHLAQRQ
jgi:hypothetical protein